MKPDPYLYGERRAREIIAERSRRARLFPNIEEPGWIILCDLYVNRGRNICVTSACLASFAPPTTALRHLGLLEAEGLIRRVPDEFDRRKTYLRLTCEVLERLSQFFDQARSDLPDALESAPSAGEGCVALGDKGTGTNPTRENTPRAGVNNGFGVRVHKGGNAL